MNLLRTKSEKNFIYKTKYKNKMTRNKFNQGGKNTSTMKTVKYGRRKIRRPLEEEKTPFVMNQQD